MIVKMSVNCIGPGQATSIGWQVADEISLRRVTSLAESMGEGYIDLKAQF